MVGQVGGHGRQWVGRGQTKGLDMVGQAVERDGMRLDMVGQGVGRGRT
jgi:hypothetical protein